MKFTFAQMAEQRGQFLDSEWLNDVTGILECCVDSADLFWNGLAMRTGGQVGVTRRTRLHVEQALIDAVLDDYASDVGLLMLANTKYAAEGLLLNLFVDL
jgi:hypothetical protein